MARRVVVDDTNSLISYEGSSWFVDNTGSHDSKGNFGPVFNKTLHATVQNTTFSFPYNGSAITVFGTNNLQNVSGVLDPQWQCFVDNVPLVSNYTINVQNNWKLCDVPPGVNIADGPHVLTVNVTVKQSQTFYFDRLTYLPSSTVRRDDKVIAIENFDPELIYDSHWEPWGPGLLANITQQPGSKVTFYFSGISLKWISYVPYQKPHRPASGTYSIDDKTPTSFTINGPTSPMLALYNQEIFTTPDFNPGLHKLDVVFLGNNETTPLSLDYLIIRRNSSAGIDQTSNGAGDKASSKSKLGATVGGVLGGLVISLGVLIVLLIHRRKMHQRRIQGRPQNITIIDTTGGDRDHSRETSMHPQPSIPNPTNYLRHASQFLPRSKLARFQEQQRSLHVQESSGNSYDLQNSAPSSTIQSNRYTPVPSQNDTHSEFVIHEDSGLRIVSPSQPQKIEVPPSYTPA
ncbi:hypothetical protein CVT24_011170 [Panaeolus cyanescens]|uniref:Uncharacterized protein n=1 Tax=Panaeolus cyanescens TaxID=181874 RepID=A0A409YGD0_9AGAR|nr:hypothetical protein CVT24_011170 [Panaeolus cyanescens]